MPRLAIVLVLSAFGPLRSQQINWTPGTAVEPFGTPNLAFDERRNRAVLVLADQTWEFDGAAWIRAAAPHAPGNRTFPGLTYDRTGSVTWLFGGVLSGTAQNDLWTWNGAAWTAVAAPAAPRPAPRWETAIAHDTARNRLVVYGGRTPTGFTSETWEFDGAAWSLAAPTISPTTRYGHELVYDQLRGVTVLFGGLDASLATPLAETWEWNGTNWSLRNLPQSPSPRYAAGLAYDRAQARVLLHGGRNSTSVAGYVTDTWAYDGATWTALPTGGTSPPIEVPVRLCFDPARGEAVTVRSRAGGLQTWAYDGSTWRSVLSNPQPGARDLNTCTYDPVRGVGVMFGGGTGTGISFNDTYDYRGGVWRRIPTAAWPPVQEALAYDPVNAAVLMWLGNAVWLFDGNAWTSRQPAVVPPWRSGYAMATDLARSRIVLFGGANFFGTISGETWEWDGTVWSLRQPATAPAPRIAAGMTYDSLRQRIVLYGGSTSTPTDTAARDPWEWDGTTWLQRSPAAAPGDRMAPGLVFDAQRGVVLMHGGSYLQFGFRIPRNDTWQWNGVVWTMLPVSSPPPTRRHIPMFYDAGLARTVLFSGDLRNDEWLLGPVSTAAVASYGTGCPGTFGVPHLRGRGLPVPGNRWFGLQVSAMAPNAFTVAGLASSPLNAPIGGGCTLLIDAPTLLWGLADARGQLEFNLPLPNVPTLLGGTLFAQIAGLDPGGAFGGVLAVSPGLRIDIDR
jgi:hypothetical protein